MWLHFNLQFCCSWRVTILFEMGNLFLVVVKNFLKRFLLLLDLIYLKFLTKFLQIFKTNGACVTEVSSLHLIGAFVLSRPRNGQRRHNLLGLLSGVLVFCRADIVSKVGNTSTLLEIAFVRSASSVTSKLTFHDGLGANYWLVLTCFVDGALVVSQTWAGSWTIIVFDDVIDFIGLTDER